MPHSKNSATRIQAAERRTQALALRRSGATYAEIGKKLGCSEQRAHRVVTLELARLNAHRSEQAAAVCRLELERLDELLAAIWPDAKERKPQAIDRVLAIMVRRAKLQGLDAPEKIAPTTPDGQRSAPIVSLTDEQLMQIAASGLPKQAPQQQPGTTATAT